MANFTGYSLEELAGRSIFDFISPDDHLATIERYRKRLKNEPVPDLHESTIVRKDGKMIPVEATSANTVYKGQPADVIYIRDISQRKYLEKSLALERDRSLNYMDVANVIIVGLISTSVNLINRKALKYWDILRKH
jgi:PAS domain S-box-containing protein